MAGRRPKPTALKKAQGNPGKRKLNELEPQPEIVEAFIPTYLSKPARRWWEMLAPMLLRLKVLTEADQLGLALLCEQAAQADEATRMIRKGGIMVKKQLYDRAGKKIGTVPVIHPAFKVQVEATKQLKSFLLEFGITPASRSKVTKMVQPEQLKRDPLGELRARAKRSR
jgi:P27 family predicted phage terminase small subunit